MSTLDPRSIPAEFWAIVEKADRDRTKMAAILESMTRDEMISFHTQFLDAAYAISTQKYVQHMEENTSEDGVDDITRWVVGQGRDYYFNVYDTPRNTPSNVEPHSKQQVFYEIARIFIRRFDDDIWSADED